MTDMNDFFTRQKANAGIKLPLSLPDGSTTDHYFMIRGIDSDAFREAENEAKRDAFQLAAMDSELERKNAAKEASLTLIASLVISWSFEQECTLGNIKAFLSEAPQIANQIDQLAARRSLFFGKRLSNSQHSQNLNSDSTELQMVQQ